MAAARDPKAKYTDKQKRKADHIAEGYEARGVPQEEAEARAWATVNKQDGGGKKPGGSGRKAAAAKKPTAAAKRPAAAAARKPAATAAKPGESVH